jgi:hypothetical protein
MCTVVDMAQGPTEPTGSDQPTTSRATRRRVTVREAAGELGITVEAVRGRIKRGTLGHHKDGGTVYVLLPMDQAQPDPASRATSRQPDHDQTADDSRLVEVLEEQNAYLREQLGEEREARRRADMLLARLTEANASMAGQIQELTAPDQGTHGPESGAESEAGTSAPPERETPSSRPERSWWRRFFGFE